MSRYLCNLLVPGAAKSGTSSLHAMLGTHPRIDASSPQKEPQFFSFDRLFEKGPEAHNSLFDDQRKYDFHLESSQSYFVHEHALERIRQCLSEPKIIFLLRHPVERLLSHYRWRYRLGWEERPLMQAVRQGGEDTTYVYEPSRKTYKLRGGGYLSFSKYSKYVPLWERCFGKENVLVVRTEELRRNQQHMASACFAFLGLSDFNVEEVGKRNTTQKTTLSGAKRFWLAKLVSEIAPNWMKQVGYYQQVGSWVQARTRKLRTPTPPEVRKHEREKLDSILAQEVDFYESVGTNLKTN